MYLIEQLRLTSSRLEKEQLLRNATDLELKVFYYALNPYKVYHVKAVGCIGALGEPNEKLFLALDILSSSRYTPNEKKQIMEDFADTYGDLIKLIVSKDLDCGVGITTVNKIKPKYIPKFQVQLAKEVPLNELSFPMLGQIKYDGVRIIIICKGGKIEFRTRNGKHVYLPRMSEILSSYNMSDYVIDSEVTFAQGKANGERATVSGLINSAIHNKKINESNLVFNCFDALTVEEFSTQVCARNYTNRFRQLMFILESMKNDHFIFAVSVPLANIRYAEMFYESLIEDGYEGCILKTSDHKYTFKRSKDWVKMKETKTVDLLCVDITDGHGKYMDQIGALVCKGTAEGKDITVHVGSGLTDHDRARPYEDYLNKTIEVSYNATIQSSVDGAWSLFLPRYNHIRFDK